MVDFSDVFSFLDRLKVWMAILIRIVDGLNFFEADSTSFTNFLFGNLFFLITFKMSFNFLLNSRVNIVSHDNVELHGLFFWFSFELVPCIPFALANQVKNLWLWSIAVALSRLLIVGIKFKFGLVISKNLRFTHEFGG